MKENICDILVSNRRQDCDRAPVSESEVFYLRSNVELRRGSKFPVSKCRFHLRTRGDVGFLLCRHVGLRYV